VWATVRIDRCHAGIFDSNLFAKAGDVLQGRIGFGFQPDSRINAAGGPTTHVSSGESRECDNVQDG
jgi:hypothetical protein